jgi:hypothetical protein
LGEDEFITGSSLRTCAVYVVPEGSSIVGVQFAPYDTEYNSEFGKPVTWK